MEFDDLFNYIVGQAFDSLRDTVMSVTFACDTRTYASSRKAPCFMLIAVLHNKNSMKCDECWYRQMLMKPDKENRKPKIENLITREIEQDVLICYS
jgi:hypothetical protein